MFFIISSFGPWSFIAELSICYGLSSKLSWYATFLLRLSPCSILIRFEDTSSFDSSFCLYLYPLCDVLPRWNYDYFESRWFLSLLARTCLNVASFWALTRWRLPFGYESSILCLLNELYWFLPCEDPAGWPLDLMLIFCPELLYYIADKPSWCTILSALWFKSAVSL